MTMIGSIKPAERADAATKEHVLKTRYSDGTENTALSLELSGEKNLSETEKQERANFEKNIKNQKSSKVIDNILTGLGMFLGTAGALAFGATLLTGVCVGACAALALAGIYGKTKENKYKETIAKETARRKANLIDEKSRETKKAGLDKVLTTKIPKMVNEQSDPIYVNIGIYNDKSGKPQIRELGALGKNFTDILAGFSTEDTPDVKGENVDKLKYQTKALFSKTKNKTQMGKANEAFDKIVKTMTATDSDGGKDITQKEMLAIRDEMLAFI